MVFDPDRQLPDPGVESPERCWRHGCDLHPRLGCAECDAEQDDEMKRLNGDEREE